MTDIHNVLAQELMSHFNVHRSTADERGVLITHVNGNLHYAAIRFDGVDGRVFVNCYWLDRRHQKAYELADPESIDKIINLIERHMDFKIAHELYD